MRYFTWYCIAPSGASRRFSIFMKCGGFGWRQLRKFVRGHFSERPIITSPVHLLSPMWRSACAGERDSWRSAICRKRGCTGGSAKSSMNNSSACRNRGVNYRWRRGWEEDGSTFKSRIGPRMRDGSSPLRRGLRGTRSGIGAGKPLESDNISCAETLRRTFRPCAGSSGAAISGAPAQLAALCGGNRFGGGYGYECIC